LHAHAEWKLEPQHELSELKLVHGTLVKNHDWSWRNIPPIHHFLQYPEWSRWFASIMIIMSLDNYYEGWDPSLQKWVEEVKKTTSAV
jgi:hypothetical protein